MYILDEEQQLLHLFDPGEGKLAIDSRKDMTVHMMEEVIEKFTKEYWSSMMVDSRTITLGEASFSTTTNFCWNINTNEDLKKTKWRKSVGHRTQRLLMTQPVPGTLLVIQVWKAEEYYFFRIKPLSGTTIIELIGQARTDLDVKMYFSGEQQISLNIAEERMLTFDIEGYIIEKQFSENQGTLNILMETPFFENNKFFVVKDQNSEISIL